MATQAPFRQERHEEIHYSSPSLKTDYKASGLVDGFLVPAGRALFIGVTAGAFVGIACAAAESPFSPWWAFGLAWLAVQFLAFMVFVRQAQFLLEGLYGYDLNGDGIIGVPEQPTHDEVEIRLYSNNGANMERFSFPGTAEQLREFSRGVLSGMGLEKELWSGGEGKLYRPVDYKNLRADLIKRGWIQHRNGSTNQICELTDLGRQVLSTYAGKPSPTLPKN
jgi:hypothetical protein